MKILFLTQLCPYPPTNGSAIKTYHILRHLGARHEISLLMFIRRESEVEALSELGKHCRRLDFCKISRSRARNAIDATRSLLTGKSFIVVRDYHPQMRQKVIEQISHSPDLIYVDHLQMFQYVPQPPPCPVLLDEHNVEWRIIERFADAHDSTSARLFASVEWPKLRDYELDACRHASRVCTVTSLDGEVLTSNGIPPEKITTLPVGVDTEYFQPLPQTDDSKTLLTFGTMSWPPNADAVTFFHRSIYPLIKREVPDARFLVVGANPPHEVREIAARDTSVTVTGFVEDIRKASRDAALFVVPLRIGSGMRVKILDAMAMGLPIVSTSIGSEGISAQHGVHLMLADEPDEFAETVISLLRNPDKRARLGRSGRHLVETMYSWDCILPRLDRALSMLSAG